MSAIELPAGREARLQAEQGRDTDPIVLHALQVENQARITAEWAAGLDARTAAPYLRWQADRAAGQLSAVRTRALDALDVALAKLAVDALTETPDAPDRYTCAPAYWVALP